jgi:uncharacterized protein (DUF58 family)
MLGVEELYVLAAAVALLVALAAVAVRMSATTVAVRRGISAVRLRAGESAEVTLDLRNDSRWEGAPLLLVEDQCSWTLADRPRFHVDGLRAGGTRRLRYPLHPTMRGRYTIGPLRVVVRDPFEVVELVRRYHATDAVVVLPVIEPLPDGLTRGNHRGSGTSDTRRLFNTGDEFHTMREYQQGDDLRLIHWPSTAHRDALMVRQQELPWQAEATVLCDTRLAAHRGAGASSTLEKAISASASVVWHLTRHGYRLRLVTDAATRAPRAETWEALLDRLAELEGSHETTLTGLATLRGTGAEGLMVAVVAVPHGDALLRTHPDVRTLLQAGRLFASRLVVVVHSGHGDRARAEETAGLLRVAGWRAATVAPGESLTDRWGDALGSRRHQRAYQPDAAATGTR